MLYTLKHQYVYTYTHTLSLTHNAQHTHTHTHTHTVVPSLLYPLMNGARAIREAALTCLLSLFEATKTLSTPSEAPPYFHLVSSLCASQLELATDLASLVDLFRRIATDSNEHVTEKKRRQSKKKEKIDEAALKLASVDSVLGHVVMFGMPHHIQLVLLRVLSSFDHEVSHMIRCIPHDH